MGMKPLFALYVSGVLHWGFVSQVVPFSKTRLAFKAPPPTTLVGALAYPLRRLFNMSENRGETSGAEDLREVVLWSTAKLSLKLSKVIDVSKIYWYDRHPERRKADIDAVATEKIYVSSFNDATLDLGYVINGIAAEDLFGEKWKNILETGAWGISRVGQKESLYTVNQTTLTKLELIKASVVECGFYLPYRLVENIEEGSFFVEYFVPENTKIADYVDVKKEAYLIPVANNDLKPKIKIKIRDEGVAVKIGDDFTVLDREVVER